MSDRPRPDSGRLPCRVLDDRLSGLEIQDLDLPNSTETGTVSMDTGRG